DALEFRRARGTEIRLLALEAGQHAPLAVGYALAELVGVALACRGQRVELVERGRDRAPARRLDLAEMLRQALGDASLARLDPGAIGLEVGRARAFAVRLVELLQAALRLDVSGARCGKRECHREKQLSDRHGSSCAEVDVHSAPIAASARFTSATPSGSRGAC